jgi:hypothetical protein
MIRTAKLARSAIFFLKCSFNMMEVVSHKWPVIGAVVSYYAE